MLTQKETELLAFCQREDVEPKELENFDSLRSMLDHIDGIEDERNLYLAWFEHHNIDPVLVTTEARLYSEILAPLTGDALEYERYNIACEENERMPVSFDRWKAGER